MSTVFVTGFPGFLGSALVERLLERYPANVSISCLIQPKFAQVAERRANEIESKSPEWARRILLYEGDITLPDLGLEDTIRHLQRETVEIYHLAAVYDLAVSRNVGMRVNVTGTHHMLRFAESCPNLTRFQYMSTCYVSGRHNGTFSEDDLDVGQSFNNFYEETKFLAELDVRDYMSQGLPATVYRPSIVLGDSQTGKTQKYDGPYYAIQWLLRQPRLEALPVAIMPVTGNPKVHEVNVIPRNFAIGAIAYLSGIDESEGKTYQVCDPNPPTVDQMIDILSRATERQILRIPLPKLVAKNALKYMPGVNQIMRIEPEAMEYFVHTTHYTCDMLLADLEGTGIVCPPFESYADRLIGFMRLHPEIVAEAMA
jgi:thioester reductase-like protein